MIKRLLLVLVAGLACLAPACSEEDVARIGGVEGLTAGWTEEGVSSPVVGQREGPTHGDLELARAFFPELAPRPGGLAPPSAKWLRVAITANGMEIATSGKAFHVRPLSSSGRQVWAPVNGDGTDGSWVTSRIEEYVIMEARAASYRERFEVTVPDDIVTLRDAGDYVEFVDTENIPVLRMHHALARDEHGRWRRGRAVMWGAVAAGQQGGLPAFALRGRTLLVELTVGFEGFEGTVVVDPGWSSTGAMGIPRWSHSQTLLPNGKVLAAGGYSTSSGATLSSAELYDPVNGTWQATGPMLFRRQYHAATLLLNGQVLVAGQPDPSDGTTLGSAEVYSPATGAWREAGAMVLGSRYTTATLLPSGKVLVVGSSAPEVYDPMTGTWALTGPLAYPSSDGLLAQLSSGKVLVTSGSSGKGFESQLYDPASNTWSATGKMSFSHVGGSMTLLPSGEALVVGGADPGGDRCELYDAASGNWRLTGNHLLASGASLTTTLLPSGKVMATGNGAAEVYDPAAGTWQATASLPTPRTGVATLLPSGKVMVAGGGWAVPDVYDPGAGAWTATAAQATARSGATVTQLPGGKVLIAGGQGTSGPTATAELYDPAARAWLPAGSMSKARSRHTATLLPTGSVLVAGGNGTGGPLADTELYDPAAGTWSAAAPLANARSDHTATLLPDGVLLVIGGSGADAGFLSSVELFHPASGTWTSALPMGSGRSGHTATLLRDGTVLVAGGNAPSEQPMVGIYDPGADSWRLGGALLVGRTGHTATLLPTGRVLIAGGQNSAGAPLESTEIYGAPLGGWGVGVMMATARSGHTATLLPSGQVLVAGGMGVAGPTASAEIYDDGLHGAWTQTGPLATARADAAAILLTNGRVLMAGGSTTGGILASAELYEATGAGDAWRPSIAPIPPVSGGQQVTVTGSRFRGISDGSNGYWRGNSPSNVPIATLLPPGGDAWPVQLGGFSDTSLSLTMPAVSRGYYLLAVTVNAVSAGTVVFVDGPPGAPTMTAPAPAVASARPVVAGTAEAGTTVTVDLDGSTLGTVGSGSSGSWSITPTSDLPEGLHQVKARAANAFGVAGPWSPPRGFTVDLTPPAAPLFTGPGALANPRPLVGGTAEPGGLVTLWLDGVLAGTTTVDAIGRWSLAVATALPDGPHVATAQVQDAAGNTSPISAAHAFTVDGVPPPAPEIVSPGSGAMVRTRTPVISGTAESGDVVTVWVDGALAGTAGVDASGAWSCASLSTLAEGPHSITAQARDPALNVGPTSGSHQFTVDSVAPPPPAVLTPIEGAVEISETPLIFGTAEVGSQVTVWLDTALGGTVGTTDNGTWSFFPVSPLGEGSHVVVAEATDTAGNSTFSTSARTFTVRPSRPATPRILSPTGAVSTSFPTLAGKAGSGDSVDVVLDDAAAGTVRPDDEGSWTFTPATSLADGSHTARARARDPQLHTSLWSDPVTFLVDTVPPAIPVLEEPEDEALLRTGSPRLAGTAEPGSTVTVLLDGQVAGSAKADDSGAWTVIPAIPLPEGRHAAVLRATDAAGNDSLPSEPHPFTIQRMKSFYGSGCSATPGGTGAWLLLVLGPLASMRARRRRRAPGREE